MSFQPLLSTMPVAHMIVSIDLTSLIQRLHCNGLRWIKGLQTASTPETFGHISNVAFAMSLTTLFMSFAVCLIPNQGLCTLITICAKFDIRIATKHRKAVMGVNTMRLIRSATILAICFMIPPMLKFIGQEARDRTHPTSRPAQVGPTPTRTNKEQKGKIPISSTSFSVTVPLVPSGHLRTRPEYRAPSFHRCL
jgi:hypothetical protein